MCSIQEKQKYFDKAHELAWNVASSIIPAKAIELAAKDKEQFKKLMLERESIIEDFFQNMQMIHDAADDDSLTDEELDQVGSRLEDFAQAFTWRIANLQEKRRLEKEPHQ